MDEAERLWNAGDSLAAGKLLFERIPPDDRPSWAGAVLFAATVGLDLPQEVNDVFRCCFAPAMWQESKKAFEAIRARTVEAQKETDLVKLGTLLLAESCCKVAFNATNPPAPFEADAGQQVVRCAADLLRQRGSTPELSNLIRAAVFFLY